MGAGLLPLWAGGCSSPRTPSLYPLAPPQEAARRPCHLTPHADLPSCWMLESGGRPSGSQDTPREPSPECPLYRFFQVRAIVKVLKATIGNLAIPKERRNGHFLRETLMYCLFYTPKSVRCRSPVHSFQGMFSVSIEFGTTQE